MRKINKIIIIMIVTLLMIFINKNVSFADWDAGDTGPWSCIETDENKSFTGMGFATNTLYTIEVNSDGTVKQNGSPLSGNYAKAWLMVANCYIEFGDHTNPGLSGKDVDVAVAAFFKAYQEGFITYSGPNAYDGTKQLINTENSGWINKIENWKSETWSTRGYKVTIAVIVGSTGSKMQNRLYFAKEDQPSKGSIIVRKGLDTTVLSPKGFKFKLRRNNKDVTSEQETDKNGIVTFSNLDIGLTYEVWETYSPNSTLYPLNSPKKIGEVTLTSSNPNMTFSYENKRLEDGKLTITKKDKDTKDKLNGAKFRLYSLTDQSWITYIGSTSYHYSGSDKDPSKLPSFEITSNGEITIEHLRRGTYEVYEVKSPNEAIYPLSKQAGYGKSTRDGTKNWVYLGNKTIGSSTVTLDVENVSEKGSITVVKIDSTTGKELSGFKFKLRQKKNGSYVGVTSEIATDSNGKVTFSNLKLDTYEIWETYSPNTSIYPLSGWTYKGTVTLTSSNKDQEYTVTNTRPKDGKLTITKLDEYTAYRLYGAKFKIYSVDNESWLSEYTTNSDGIVAIDNLERGEYEIYETSSPDEQLYPLSEQTGYGKGPRTDTDTQTASYVYIGTKTIGDEKVYVSFDNTRPDDGEIQIEKRDKNYSGLKLEGAEFKIYSMTDNQWLRGSASNVSYTSNISQAGGFKTDSNGKLTLKGIRYGTYKIYESKTPTGYDITKQEGYKTDDVSSEQGWVYIGETREINKSNKKVTYGLDNIKIISLKGTVWQDIALTKENGYNQMLDNSDNRLSGIPVYMCRENDSNIISETTTDSNGEYKFEDLNYWDVANYYILFKYDNKKYINVSPFTGNNGVSSKAQEYTVTVEKLDDRKLDGEGIAVTYKDKSGRMNNYNSILTDKDILTAYYNTGTYTIENINLGIMEIKDPNYSIKEELAYIKVSLNGYTYTYNYGETSATNNNTVIESLYVPTTSMQTLTGGYTAQIYPSDVAYNAANGGDKLKLYVVYKITVNNDETENFNDNYVEQRLFLNSLTNSFDVSRYTLANNENLDDEHGSDFKLWSTPEIRTNDQGNNYGVTSYDVNNENSVYKNGVEKNSGEGMDNNAVSSYIQFRMKDNALKAILDGNYNEYHEEVVPTQTTTDAYHDYLRTDNIWNSNTGFVSWRGNSSIENGYRLTSSSDKKAFVHRSEDKSAKSYGLYVHMKLGDARTISGKVFEDEKHIQVGDATIGDGIYQNTENVAGNVKVELLHARILDDLNSDNSNIADLYVKDDSNSNHYSVLKAQTVTNDKGEYSITGVVPGYYYLRFTYGDGNQAIYTTSGQKVCDVKLIDYRSTVISSDITNIMKKANEAELTSTNQEEVEWYKFLNTNKSYSVATDDISLRETFNDNIYEKDGENLKINNGDNDASNIKAFTPRTSISIENDVNSSGAGDVHKPAYQNFNFGIMEDIKTKIDVDKKIENLSVTTQVGNDITSGNPANSTIPYITDLDRHTPNGSKAAKLEISKDTLYGGKVKVTYNIAISNNSDVDYINETNPEIWYYYGIIDSNTHKKVTTVEEVTDYIDKKYDLGSITPTTTSTGDEIEFKEERETKKIIDGQEVEVKTLSIKGWKELNVEETKSVNYTVQYLVSSDDDMAFYNDAQITQLKLDKMTTLQTSFTWEEDDTVMTIVPPTGENRSKIYYVIGTISLITLAIGMIVIKKTLRKN